MSDFSYFQDKFQSLNFAKIHIYSQNFQIFIIKQITNSMTQRRAWTEEEDKVLKYLKDAIQVKKWSQISRRLQFQYNLPGRNGKQCRQRYTNHLDSSIISKEFTLEEEEKLFKLHEKIGNKWSHISKQFKGRTDNHIKNHFHSKLRKAIRKLNKQIKINFKKTAKPYKLSIIYKVVESSDYRFSEKVSFTNENLKFFNDLKNSLLQYAGGKVQKGQISVMKDKQQAIYLISKLQIFEKYLKMKKIGDLSSHQENRTSQVQLSKKSDRNCQTSNSQHSCEQENEKYESQSQEQNLIYEDASFQFVNQINQGSQRYKSMEDEKTNSNQSEKQIKRQEDQKFEIVSAKNFYSFLKNEKQQLVKLNQKQIVLNSLIEEIDFSELMIERKMSVKSFQSLREFQDSCLNDSQISMMLKRFDSFSNIQAGLFE